MVKKEEDIVIIFKNLAAPSDLIVVLRVQIFR